MSSCLSGSSPELEDELVSLYTTLIDEDNFKLENDDISAHDGFLKDVEEKLIQRGNTPSERSRLEQVKNKILDQVKTKKLKKRSRDRSSSVSSLKRGSSEVAGGDLSRLKTEESKTLDLSKSVKA